SAFSWYAKVFREQPGDQWTRDQLARLSGLLDNWAELAAVYQLFLDDTSRDSDGATIDVLRTAAEIYDQRLDKIDEAKECYRRLLAQSSEDLQAFDSLEAMLLRSERWMDLLNVYHEAVKDTLDHGRKKSLLFKTSDIEENRLYEPTSAIRTYREIL